VQEQLEQIHHSLQGFVLVGRERLVRRLIHGRNRIEPSLLTANLTARRGNPCDTKGQKRIQRDNHGAVRTRAATYPSSRSWGFRIQSKLVRPRVDDELPFLASNPTRTSWRSSVVASTKGTDTGACVLTVGISATVPELRAQIGPMGV